MDIRELEKIGLSEKEASVYLALLELGSETVQNIAKKSNVNRATTYVILESLRKKGIVSTVEQGKKTHFIAESPQELLRLIHMQEAETKNRVHALEAMMPELKSIHNRAQNKPVVRFYEGREGIETMLTMFYEAPVEEIELMYSRDNVERVFPPEEREQHLERRLKKKKKVKTIYTSSKGLRERIPDADERWVPSDRFPIKSDIAIMGNKVRIASLEKHLSGIVIEDEEIAATLRAVFGLAWEAAEKYQKSA